MKYSIKRFTLSIILLIFSTFLLLIGKFKIELYNLYFFIPLWLFFMYDIWKVIIPKFSNFSPYGKLFKKFYKEAKKINYTLMKKQLRKTNFRAVIFFILWLVFLVVLGVNYYRGYITINILIYIVVVLNFFDYFSINVWCPFHKIIIKDKCCNTCRIYNWDHFLKFSPLYLIFSFWSYSLLVSSIIALIQWEILRFTYPERFTEYTNRNLSCSECILECRFNKKSSYLK